MRVKWIALITISLIMMGCAPTTQIKKIHIRVDQQNSGDVDIFNSFDEVGRSYEKVADLMVTDTRPLNEKSRNRMIESLKSVARELGAEGIVIIEEKETVTKGSIPAGGGPTKVYNIFINSIAVIYR